jgi:hypothetical protein
MWAGQMERKGFWKLYTQGGLFLVGGARKLEK